MRCLLSPVPGRRNTAQTATRVMSYLKYVPETLVRVRVELDSVVPDEEVVPTWSELQRLPHLVSFPSFV
jgi:hypothetical protein